MFNRHPVTKFLTVPFRAVENRFNRLLKKGLATLIGKWRIVASGAWPRDHLDLCGPAFLRIDADGTGEMAFGALCASVDGGFTVSVA